MEAHLTDECRVAGWQIPAYDNGVFIGYIHLGLSDDWCTGYKAFANLKLERND